MASPVPGLGPELFLTELKVTDWPRAVRWYVEILGLRVVLSDPEPQYALLAAGSGRVALKGGGSEDLGRNAVRLVFQVEDAEAERARLLDLGVAVGPMREISREGYREVRLADPEGVPITLFSWLKGET
jgi:catechol 2,3-dioxygenase-like lactoylglutathione lyase family enzyme